MEGSNVLIIGVSGKMRHGKDAIGEYLVDNYSFVRGSFGDEVKRICMYYNSSHRSTQPLEWWDKFIAEELLEGNVTPEEVNRFMLEVERKTDGNQSWTPLTYEECYETKPARARLKMQTFAQGMRDLHSPCWVNYLMKTCTGAGGRWVIPDLRYKNEAFAIEAIEGSQLWRVSRDTPDMAGSDHISETDLDDYPFEVYIDNNGSLKDLYKKIDKIIRPILRGARPFAEGGEVY